MTIDEFQRMTEWIGDQYRMAIEFNEAYVDSLRGITDRMEAGELTPAEGRRLLAEYDKAREGMDRHIAEVREIQAGLERKVYGKNIGRQ